MYSVYFVFCLFVALCNLVFDIVFRVLWLYMILYVIIFSLDTVCILYMASVFIYRDATYYICVSVNSVVSSQPERSNSIYASIKEKFGARLLYLTSDNFCGNWKTLERSCAEAICIVGRTIEVSETAKCK